VPGSVGRDVWVFLFGWKMHDSCIHCCISSRSITVIHWKCICSWIWAECCFVCMSCAACKARGSDLRVHFKVWAVLYP
jgi:hypothetical protein